MCGICGVFNYGRSDAVEEKVILKMRDTMIHRGPDDKGVFLSSEGRTGLGHRRLSIIDLSPSGRQPLCNEDETIWIVYNGETYNYQELMAGLEAKGHIFKSKTDTEVLVHLYEEYGKELVHKLRGMFAFAIWDCRKQRLFLARDRIGIKPLYYTVQNGCFLFASEIKAILEHPEVKKELDEQALYHYLTFVVSPAPSTLFKGIKKLAPGHLLIIDSDGNVDTEWYWDEIDSIADSSSKVQSEDFYKERIRELLRESIKDRMISDVPFGVFLSGGVDSSTNVALMTELMDRPVDTFSVGFKDQDQYNEFAYAREISQKFGTNHHEIMIDHQDLVDYVPRLIYHQDEPIADPVCVPLFYVSKLARDNGIIVVQVGEGSDELFSGYESYSMIHQFYQNRWRYYQLLPLLSRKALYHAMKPLLEWRKMLNALDYLQRASFDRGLFWGGAIAFTETLKKMLMSESYKGRTESTDSFSIVNSYFQRLGASEKEIDQLAQMIYLELKIRLPELLLMRVDKISMSTSIEARVPFLDHRLVEFAMSIPTEMKIKGQPKYILKKAVEGLIPQHIIYRKKQGFGAPIKEWFKGDLAKYAADSIFDSRIRERDLFNYDYIENMMREHQSGQSDYSFFLWNLFNLSCWYDRWIA